MKVIISESTPFYDSYTFNYAIYAKSEGDDFVKIYDHGFLPYTGNKDLSDQYFYLCRSLRIKLSSFSLNSENRRTLSKLDSSKINLEVLDIKIFANQKTSINFCLDYAKERFQSGFMDYDRLNYILNWSEKLRVFKFSYQNELLGYVLGILGSQFFHYWYAFYNLNFNSTAPVGKFMMTYMINYFKSMEMDYVYLGTCYHTKSLYKAKDFKGMEFFDGNEWNPKLKELKLRCKADDETNDNKDWLKKIDFKS